MYKIIQGKIYWRLRIKRARSIAATLPVQFWVISIAFWYWWRTGERNKQWKNMASFTLNECKTNVDKLAANDSLYPPFLRAHYLVQPISAIDFGIHLLFVFFALSFQNWIALLPLAFVWWWLVLLLLLDIIKIGHFFTKYNLPQIVWCSCHIIKSSLEHCGKCGLLFNRNRTIFTRRITSGIVIVKRMSESRKLRW